MAVLHLIRAGARTAIGVVCCLGLANVAAAQDPLTVAYWRFETISGLPGAVGAKLTSVVPGGPGATTFDDSAGNGNVLRTFHSPNVPSDPDFAMRIDSSPDLTANVPAATVAATGLPNLRSADFDSLPALDQPAPAGTLPNDAGADDIYSLDGNNGPTQINSYVFNSFTIEASFRIDTLGRFQTILGKDDNPNAADGPLGPFSLKLLDNNALEAYAFDGTNVFRNVLSNANAPITMAAGVWYNAAITNDGAQMRMYLDDTSDGVGNYVLLAENNDIETSALIASTDIWTVGRGWFNDGEGPGPNGVADFFDGQIDEVRITDGVLDPADFLFAVDQPAIDANFDSSPAVDGNDFLIWQRNVGGTGGNGQGDADGNGQINSADYQAWRTQYGMPMAEGATAAVPEPATMSLVLLAAMAVGAKRAAWRGRNEAS
jgi:hypothetical protein